MALSISANAILLEAVLAVSCSSRFLRFGRCFTHFDCEGTGIGADRGSVAQRALEEGHASGACSLTTAAGCSRCFSGSAEASVARTSLPPLRRQTCLERREHGLHQATPVVRPLKLFGILLPLPEHLCPRVVALEGMVLTRVDHGPPATVTDHPVVLVCVACRVKHHAPRVARHPSEDPPEPRRVVGHPLGNLAGHDPLAARVCQHVQLDEPAPGYDPPLGVFSALVLHYGEPAGILQQGSARRIPCKYVYHPLYLGASCEHYNRMAQARL